MATIVAHRKTGERFVVVGAGYAATETATPGVFLGNLSPDIATKAYGMVAVCDGHGNIGWFASKDVVVVSVHGQSPAELLAR